MRRHRRRSQIQLRLPAMLATVALVAVAAAWLLQRPGEPPAGPAEAAGPCVQALRIVTSRSYAPVLRSLAPALATGEDCGRLDIVIADGRDAVDRVGRLDADVWIPDDFAWASRAADGVLAEPAEPVGQAEYAEPAAGGPGMVVAISPIYMVAGKDAAALLADTGGGWLGLANLVTGGSGVQLTVRDPAGWGDGLIGVGSLGEAVWVEGGMDASAEALATALPATRTVLGQALPGDSNEVGLVAEYALISMLDEDGTGAATIRGSTIFAGSDNSAVLRYTWLPTAAAVADPSLTRPLERVLRALTGGEADQALASAGLRRPDASPPPGVPDVLPELAAEPFEVLGGHAVDHVFATWYLADRRSDMLVVIDVSGSTAANAAGSNRPLINVVRDATRGLAELLPNDSELGIWVFGSRLDPPRDYRTLLKPGLLNSAQRSRLVAATGRLAAESTGSGLYETLLAGYRAARNSYREGIPCHLILFTARHGVDDPGSLTASELQKGLRTLLDPDRPVNVTIVSFGPESNAEALEDLLEPVDGYVDPVNSAEEVRAVFIHMAAGGVHH